MRTPSTILTLASLSLLALAPTRAQCPNEDRIVERLEGLRTSRASRTVRFDTDPPLALYRKAARRPGTAVSAREGKKGFGVLVAELPIELLWAAVNDEEHHTLDGGYLPVRHSEIVEGRSRGQSRLLFQYFKKAGVGRWWVSRVQMNADLFEESEGGLWELHWEGRMDEIDPDAPPMNMVSRKMQAVRDTRGAWLMVPLADRCTLVEYFTWTDPGGFVGATQWLLAGRVIRSTLSGLTRMAEDHVSVPHPDAEFVRPDGSPLFGTEQP